MNAFFWLPVGGMVSFVLAVYAILRVNRAYQNQQRLSGYTVFLVWFLYIYHTALVLLSAWFAPLRLFRPSWLSGTFGVLLLIAGIGITSLSIYQFHSLSRMSGQRTDRLITSGIYTRSRNPQNLGWLSGLLGIAVIGGSLTALIFSILFCLVIHYYTVRVEEPFLKQMYGERFEKYTQATARYWGTNT